MAVTWNANYELTPPLPQDSPTGIDDEGFKRFNKWMKNEHETFETDNSSGAEGDDFVHKAGSARGIRLLSPRPWGNSHRRSGRLVLYISQEWVGLDS